MIKTRPCFFYFSFVTIGEYILYLVNQGLGAMTTTKEELRGVLVDLREDLNNSLKQMEEAKVLDISGTGYTNHQADDATAVFDQTANASAFKAAKTRLRQVEEALAKHDAGTYGICENCGREIDIARLEAMPYTPVCLRCAESRDYRAGM